MERARYIAVEGPIGAGKSALAAALAERMGGRLFTEPVEDNPFLPRFYQDRRKHAFETQLFFLLSRYQQQQELAQQELFSRPTLSDYLFAKDRIFAALTLDADEMALYQRIYEMLGPRVAKPDLVIYLQVRVEVLLSRIRKRGRDFERTIDPSYLEALARAYREFFFHYDETPLLVVNASDLDLGGGGEELEPLLAVIRKHRAGVQHYIPLGTRQG